MLSAFPQDIRRYLANNGICWIFPVCLHCMFVIIICPVVWFNWLPTVTQLARLLLSLPCSFKRDCRSNEKTLLAINLWPYCSCTSYAHGLVLFKHGGYDDHNNNVRLPHCPHAWPSLIRTSSQVVSSQGPHPWPLSLPGAIANKLMNIEGHKTPNSDKLVILWNDNRNTGQ